MVTLVLAGTEAALAALRLGMTNAGAKEIGLRHLDWIKRFSKEKFPKI